MTKKKFKGGRPRANKKRICVTLQPDIYDGISKEACRLGIDRSALLACICAKHLEARANLLS